MKKIIPATLNPLLMIKNRFLGRMALAGCLLAAAAQIGRAQITQNINLNDIGSIAPTPGTYDAYQTNYEIGSNFKPGGLNYYWDNGVPTGSANGSTFYTGANPQGYVLNTLAVNTLGGGGSDGLGSYTMTQPYWVRIFSVTGSNSASLVAYFITPQFSFTSQGDWLQVSGLNLPLLPNQEYAYTFSRSWGGYENLGATNGIPYTTGQVCEIPPLGGAINFGSSANWAVNFVCGTFDIGLSLPSALTVGPPTANPASDPVNQGTVVTLTTGQVVDPNGNGTYTYQWMTDGGGNNGSLTNIPGATSVTYSANTSLLSLGTVNFAVQVTDSTSAQATSAELPLVVTATISAVFSDIGTATPVASPYDQGQLVNDGNANKNSGSLNYYTDDGQKGGTTPYDGQTFTTGGNSQGYLLQSLSMDINGGTFNSSSTLQRYDVFFYSMSADGTTATLMADITNLQVSYTGGHWISFDISATPIALQPNTTYAYAFGRASSGAGYCGISTDSGSSDLYPAGKLVGLWSPSSAYYGTIEPARYSGNNADATFLARLRPAGLNIVLTPTSSLSPVIAGSSYTLTCGTIWDSLGNGTYTYQWQTDGGSGGALTNIPGATSATYLAGSSTNLLGNIQYDVVVTDSTAQQITSSILTLDVLEVLSGTFADITNPPVVGGYDTYQLVTAPYQGAGQLNYYDDATVAQGGAAGETFLTGTNGQGYSFVSLAYCTGVNPPYEGYPGPLTPQAYDLHIYQITGGGANAVLLASVTNLNASYSSTNYDWVQWTFPAFNLLPNTTYAYTILKDPSNTTGSYSSLATDDSGTDLYPGGQMVEIQAAGGTVTYSTATTVDAAFDIGLIPLGVSMIVNVPSATPNPAYALSPIVLHDTVSFPPSGSFTYQWLTDDGTGATPPNYIAIPGATGTNLTVTLQNLSPLADYTTNFYFAATYGPNTATSAVVTVTVHPPSAPIILSSPALPLVTFQGFNETLTATENGTLPITNQWQFDDVNNDGFGNLNLMTNAVLTLNNLQPGQSGTYQLTATNLVGGTNTTPVSLTVVPIPPAPIVNVEAYYNAVYTNHPYVYWRLNETSDPNVNDYVNGAAPVVQAWDYSGNGFLATYGDEMTLSNAGPSSLLNPAFPGFNTNELSAGFSVQTGGYATVPALNLAGQTNLTFMAWIYPNGSQAASTGLLFNRGGPDSACGFGFGNNTDNLGYTWNNNAAATYNWNSGVVVEDNTWNFVAYVLTPSNTVVYLGNIYGTTNFYQAVNPVANTGETFAGGTLRLGSDNNSATRIFDGDMAEVCLFTNSLSTAQVQQYFLTAIGASALAPTVVASVSASSVYQGQNVILNGSASGSAPLGYQWQSSVDNSTWVNVPGGATSSLVLTENTLGYFYYQLVVTNAAGAVTNSSGNNGNYVVQVNALPATPPGLWTVNFQPTNNIGANQTVGGGVGHYVGRGILGTGSYWNILPMILPASGPYNAATIISVTDFMDDGVTPSGIWCQMNNGGAYDSLGGSLPYSGDIGNLLDQFYRTYYSDGVDGDGALQFFGVPAGTYNLVCYGGSGYTTQGANDYGSTYVVFDPVNGNQTNSTAEPSFAGSSLQQGVNFVVFTGVHISGELNVDVLANAATGGSAIIQGAQLQLVSYDSVAPSVPLTGTYTKGTATVAPTMTLTWPEGFLQTATNLLGPWTTINAESPITLPATNSTQFYRVLIHN